MVMIETGYNIDAYHVCSDVTCACGCKYCAYCYNGCPQCGQGRATNANIVKISTTTGDGDNSGALMKIKKSKP